MCCARFLFVFLRTEIQGRLDIGVPKQALHRFCLDLSLVEQPVAQTVPEVVKPKPLRRRQLNARRYCCRPQVVLHERRSPDGHFTVLLQRRENEIIRLAIGCLRQPDAQLPCEYRVERDECIGCPDLGLSDKKRAPRLPEQ